MKFTLGLTLLATVVLAACAGNPSRENIGVAAAGHGKGRDMYTYAATEPTGNDFDYAPNSRDNLFDYKTLRLNFTNQVNESNEGLDFILDVNIANAGTKAFSWEDYTPYLGVQDAHGDWSYRMLFTQSAVRSIPPRKPVNIRYHTSLRGERLPEKYVVVLQSMFGGRDVGFAFGNPTRKSN